MKYQTIHAVESLLLIFASLAATSVKAAPFARWLEVKTVQGQTVRVWAEGDEFAAHFETEDGYAVAFDQTRKVYVYVDKESDGSLVSTEVALGEERSKRDRFSRLVRHLRDTSEKHCKTVRERMVREQVDTGLLERWRTRKAMRHAAAKGGERSANGTVVGVTILIDFPVSDYDSSSYWDRQHPSVTATDIGDMLNGENFTKWGNASSVRSYYKDASCGHLDYSNVVLGPFKAPRPRSYYNDSSVDAGYCAQVLLMEIFEQMKSSEKWSTEYLPTLQKASYEGKNILALNVLYAGPYPTVWSYGLWPHKSTLSSNVYSLLPISIDGDTKHLYTYEISPITQSPAIGTICHESGHMVCDFPDFYSYYHGSGCGAGNFSLMGGTTDDKNPEYFDPYLRAVAGWITPKPLPSSGTVTVAADLTNVWKYVNTSNPQEYYLIENRQKAGRDVGIPAAGVLIWRCDESSENYYADPLPAFANRTDGTQYRLENELSLEQADGTYAIERRVSIPGDSTDAWFAGNASDGYEASGGTFSDTTLPTAQWKDGSNSGLRLSRFSASSSSMTFLVGTGSSGEKPNLKPYQPTGWGAPVVISDDPDDMNGKTSFASGSELYLNWAFLNEGAATESQFWIRLYVDDEYEWDWYSEPPLNSGFYVHPSNPYLMNELSKGQHKITVVADEDGDINESDEDDNVYTVWVTVEGDLSTALDNDSLELWTEGDTEWFAQTAVTSDGEDAAQSGAIGNDGTSSLYTTVTGEGTISFFWNVSSENGWDNLAFFVDGEEMAKISGSPGWAKYTLEIKTSGTHDIEWRYSKDASAAAGQDCGWVDQVEWLPAGTPSVTVSFYANGGTLPSGASPKVYYVGSRYGDLPVPTMSDYSFAGWWTSSSGGSLVTADSVVSPSVTALYAHWTYVGGGGGGGGGSVAGGKYALCVGLNEYNQSYIPSYKWLKQCVADANSVYDMLTGSGGWDEGAFKYVNAQGTRSAVLAKLADFASVAQSGDQVIYYHSSHGGSNGPQDDGFGNDKDAHLCMYDGELTDTDFANALLGFRQGVKLLIVIDACRSGGMFQAPRPEGSRAVTPEWDFAACVMEKYERIRTQATVRGDAMPRLSGSDIAWITAANYDEYSYELNDGPGGAFTRAWTQGVIGGAADSEDLAGDGDGIVTAWEAAQYAGRAIANWSKVQCPYESASRAIILAEVASATLGEALGEDYEWVTSAEDGDYSDGAWYSIGDLDDIGWFGEGAESLDGCAARSGAIIDYERTSLRMSVSGEGTVSFKWKVSSERNYDWLTFSVDGVIVGRISGADGDWTEFTYVVPGDGSHELVWTYAKDVSGSEGEDCGWVDQFRWSCEGPVNPGQPPANDDFARAETVNGSSGTASGDSANATGESADPLPGRTVWWRWTAPADGMVTFCTKGSDFDTMLGVYAGSVFEDIQEVAEYNDDADDVDDFTSKLSFEAEAGVEYRILVTGYARSGGSIQLSWGPADDSVRPGKWTSDVDAVKEAAQKNGRMIAIAYGNLADCGHCQVLEPLINDEEFLSWAEENGVYLVCADACKFDDVDAARRWFSSCFEGDMIEFPTIVFVDASDLETCLGQGTFRNGRTVGDIQYESTVDSLIECFEQFLPDPPEADFTYELDLMGGYARITGYNGTGSVVTVPETLDGYPVWIIDASVFSGHDEITEVTLPCGIDKLPEHLFADCTGLKTVRIEYPEEDDPYASVEIYDTAFVGCTSLEKALFSCGQIYLSSEDEDYGQAVPIGKFVRDGYVLSDWWSTLDRPDPGVNPVERVNVNPAVTGWKNPEGYAGAYWKPLNPPVNDDLANATVLTGDRGFAVGSNERAIYELDEPRHKYGDGLRTVWWKWTAPATASYSFDTRGSAFDTCMTVYKGTDYSSLEFVGGNDDGDFETEEENNPSLVTFDAEAGETYCIVVCGCDYDCFGAIQLNWWNNDTPVEVTFGPDQSSAFNVPGKGTAVIADVGNLNWSLFAHYDCYGTLCFVNDGIVDAEKTAERDNDDFWCGAMTDMNMMFMQGWILEEYDTVDEVVAEFARTGESDIRWADDPEAFDPTNDYYWMYEFHEGKYGYQNGEAYYDGMFRWLRDSTSPASDILSHVTTGTVNEDFPKTLKENMPGKLLHLIVGFEDGNEHPFWGGCAVTHHVLCCGYVSDEGSLGPSALKGLFIIDPDNDQYAGEGGASAPNSIAYCPVEWTGSKFEITGIWGETGMIEPQFVALGAKDEAPIPPPDVDTEGEVVLGQDGKAVASETYYLGGVMCKVDVTVLPQWITCEELKINGSTWQVSIPVSTSIDTLLVRVSTDENKTDEDRSFDWEFKDAAEKVVFTLTILQRGKGGDPDPDRPANDDFAKATELEGESGNKTGLNVNATRERGEPYHCGSAAEETVWWKWTAPADGTNTITTQGSSFDTVLAVYTGEDVAHLTLVDDNDDADYDKNQYWSRVAFETIEGETYYIAVAGAAEEKPGSVRLNWNWEEGCGGCVPDPGSYTIKFDSGDAESDVEIDEIVADIGEFVTLPACSYKYDGHYFDGWRCETTGEKYGDRQGVRDLGADGDSVTLVAQWRTQKKARTYTVVFKSGDDGDETSAAYMPGTTYWLDEVPFDAPGGMTFAGWYCPATGKSYADREKVVDLANVGGEVTLVAQWKGQGKVGFPQLDDGLLEDEKKDVQIGFAAYVYDGYLLATNEDSSIAGVVTVKVDKKGKTTATVTRIGVKKLTYKSQMPIAKGEVDLVCTKDSAPMHLTVYAGAIEGSCGAYQVKCRQNVAKENPAGYMAVEGKVWAIALKADEQKASDTMRGYASLTVTGAKKGKVKVSGLLPDGTKVSATAQASVRSGGVVMIPVVAQLYSGKIGGISLALRVDGKGEAEVCGVGKWKSLTGDISWDAAQSDWASVNVFGITRTTDMFVLEEQPELIGGMNVATQFLHSVSNMTFMGKKWNIAKGGKIKFMGADFVDQAASPNPGGLTLSYTPKTGAFKGKYVVYVNNFGKSKKLSATINGVVVGESGYGTAVIKNQRSIPVRVDEQKK